ncbi:hypothetical protein SAMD00019534_104460 [Acytostelium subglobosum LB1]|uniref:hypothetical protein n=1 Tax=Acytostelium subglobosum LB1 TaxID=1410327 RepID=UPI000644C4EB|nr:hypothetical protein SAMD00019534_104460 [Acytostelium subglobosum LB1]GAM27271.1 hypothetical protein SAMD00019534_104460 [Acytostelium subglobosum LB1]|eukprot:XP_012749738.1 hypothetical protein SAMD00019534_104460 [Acytostelium subglobosum LB1]
MTMMVTLLPHRQRSILLLSLFALLLLLNLASAATTEIDGNGNDNDQQQIEYCNNNNQYSSSSSSSNSKSSSISSSCNIDSIIDDDLDDNVYNDNKQQQQQQQQQETQPNNVGDSCTVDSSDTDNDLVLDLQQTIVQGQGDNDNLAASSANPNDPPPLQEIYFTLNFTGDPVNCTTCQYPDLEDFYPNYSCSNDSNWNDGILTFDDPIPYSDVIVLRKAIIQIYGHYTPINPSMVILLDDDIFSDQFDPPSKNLSSCPNCVTSSDIYMQVFPNGLPSYRYNGTNSFKFVVSGNSTEICLSTVWVIFFYGPTSYTVEEVVPSQGPATGGTPVNIYGTGFAQDITTICRFGTITTEGTYINSSLVTCTTPNLGFSINGFFNVSVQVSFDSGVTYSYPNTNANFSFFYFPSKPLVPNKIDRIIIIAIGAGLAAAFLTGIVVYFMVKRWQSNRGFFPNSININHDEKTPLIFGTANYKTLFEIKPIDMSEIVIQNRIGRGSCAEVFTGTWRGIIVAIKKAKLLSDDDEDFLTELAQEAAIMSQLRHPNVCQFLGTCNNPPEVLIVMEYMPLGSLYKILHDQSIVLDWKRIKSIAMDIARGMNYLHCSDPIIIHRDLKSHNLLVDEHFRVKISDFGLSTRFKQHLDKKTTMTPVGTPCWTAPEVLRNDPYTEKADIFSYAIVLWELVTRQDPYQGMPTFQIVISVGQHRLRPVVPSNVSGAFTRLLTECWSEDPTQRPSFQEIVKRLEGMDIGKDNEPSIQ